jgi:hypothetical protein
MGLRLRKGYYSLRKEKSVQGKMIKGSWVERCGRCCWSPAQIDVTSQNTRILVGVLPQLPPSVLQSIPWDQTTVFLQPRHCLVISPPSLLRAHLNKLAAMASIPPALLLRNSTWIGWIAWNLLHSIHRLEILALFLTFLLHNRINQKALFSTIITTGSL